MSIVIDGTVPGYHLRSRHQTLSSILQIGSVMLCVGLILFLGAHPAAGGVSPDEELVNQLKNRLNLGVAEEEGALLRFIQLGNLDILIEGRQALLGVPAPLLIERLWIYIEDVELNRRGRIIGAHRGEAYLQIRTEDLSTFLLNANETLDPKVRDAKVTFEGNSIILQGSYPLIRVPVSFWLRGHFALNGTTKVDFKGERLRVGFLPISLLLGRLERDMNPILDFSDFFFPIMLAPIEMNEEVLILRTPGIEEMIDLDEPEHEHEEQE
ncbi:MAG: hypothetical protein ACE5JP_04620 [Candidatus Bipolaricaulia bacterium]